MATQFRNGTRVIVEQARIAATTGADTLSAAFSSQTRYARVGVAPGGAGTAYIIASFGAGTPATSTSSPVIPAGWVETYAVGAGEKVAIKAVGSALTVSVTEVE
jgi:hypothetical protein